MKGLSFREVLARYLRRQHTPLTLKRTLAYKLLPRFVGFATFAILVLVFAPHEPKWDVTVPSTPATKLEEQVSKLQQGRECWRADRADPPPAGHVIYRAPGEKPKLGEKQEAKVALDQIFAHGKTDWDIYVFCR